LKASFIFNDFTEAFSFMTAVALYAEKYDHHPYWINVYNKVDVVLQTHDAGNTVTEKDRKMALFIDQVYARYRR
jgi:4a-hydroxytetrahydrobiopterin dehydratase